MEKDREEHYWTRLASSYDRDGEYVVGKQILQGIEETLLTEKEVGNAIELGCGTGYFTKVIAKNASHVVATDLSDSMLNFARTELGEFKNITFHKADCASTSFAEENFDSVFMLNLLHVIDTPLQCLQEGHRILRRGGALIVIDFTGYQMPLSKKIMLGFRYVKTWGPPPRSGNNAMSRDELVSLVETSGFKVDTVRVLTGGANAIYLKCIKQ